ncbi:MAG TPA: ammonium transporter [Azospirillaceae bacterium]|nr:ammonium transporter [Azospirillaceae bacterium]
MKRTFAALPPALAAALALAPIPALAQGAAPTVDPGVTAWMLTSTALVLMMTIPGLALFYGGMVRKMNVLATVMQSFAICCLVAVVWMVVGYSVAFSNGNPLFGGLDRVLLTGFDWAAPFKLGGDRETAVQTAIPESVFIMFQMTFAIITPALIAGAFADRMRFSSLLVFVALWSVLVYSPVAHWVWHPEGFLFAWGVLDFAGGTVVHINAGVAGLVAALVVGRRKGYPAGNFAPHNLVLSLIGASLLWIGWFGFNAGSAVAADGRAGMAMLVTMIASAGGALAWMFAEWSAKGKPSVLGIISGAVAGLVAVTPASGFVLPGPALIIGAAAGLVCYWASTSLKHRFGYDDSLDCFGVHGIGGIVGALLTGVFARGMFTATDALPDGASSGLLEGNVGQLLAQFNGVAITAAYSAIATFVILKVVDAVMGLRVEEEVERDGLDLALHGEVVH